MPQGSPVIPNLMLSGWPRFTLQSTSATLAYFGIDAAQAIASGLPAFDAMGDAHSAGAGALVSYQIDPQWQVSGYVEYQRLLGDTAASPLVSLRGSRDQTTVGLGASCSFDFKID